MQTSERLHNNGPVTRGKRNSVSSVFAIGSGTFKAKNKKEATMEAMYARPSGLMFSGTFYELRQKGKLEDKWLLINVQAENFFNSHVLNRDVWSDECIVDMVKCTFIFWQTQHFKQADFRVGSCMPPTRASLEKPETPHLPLCGEHRIQRARIEASACRP